MRQIRDAHVQSNHHAKFSYKGTKAVGVTDYTNYTPKAIRSEKNSKFNTRQKLREYFLNEHKIRDAHLQCVNNHYAKFEYKGMKSV